MKLIKRIIASRRINRHNAKAGINDRWLSMPDELLTRRQKRRMDRISDKAAQAFYDRGPSKLWSLPANYKGD